MWREHWFVFLCTLNIGYGCWGGGGGDDGKVGENDTGPVGSGLTGERPTGPPKYNKSAGGLDPNYWQAPPGFTMEDIKLLLKQERKKIKEYEAQMSSSEKRRPKDADDDWPNDWADIGYPYKGNAPPPHAIMSQAGGKAALCFQPPLIGNCERYVYRYGYNPYKGICERFVYGGCGANANNFISKKRCKEVCVGLTKSTCVGSKSNYPTPYNPKLWIELPTIPTNISISTEPSTTTTTMSNQG